MMETIVKGNTQLKTFSFEWKIKRFFADCKLVGDHYDSPLYSIPYTDKITRWSVEVYPKGIDEQNKDWVSMYLSFDCETELQVTVDYRISMVSKRNSIPPKVITGFTFQHPSTSWGWPQFISQSFIKEKSNKILIDDTLTISCEITFHTLDLDVSKSFYDYNNWLSNVELRLGDYESLLETGDFADVTFNVNGEQLHLHKAILTCRSSVFDAMFSCDMKENTQNFVDITDIDYVVAKELFRFIYSGKVLHIEDIASELLIAADKYQVMELKAWCEKILYDALTVDNATDYLYLLEMCHTIHLQRLVIQFIADHYKVIVLQPEFANVNSTMMHQIILAVAERN